MNHGTAGFHSSGTLTGQAAQVEIAVPSPINRLFDVAIERLHNKHGHDVDTRTLSNALGVPYII